MNIISNICTLKDVDELGIMNIRGQVIVSSRDIAKVFEKEHFNVLRDIKNLECSPEFNESNFGLVSYKDEKGELRPEYHITRDGFAFLAMGFTGKKAARFKEAYIKRFNEMEQELIRIREKELIKMTLPPMYKTAREVDLKNLQIREYVDDRCELGEKYQVKFIKLYNDFKNWCFDNHLKSMRASEVSLKLVGLYNLTSDPLGKETNIKGIRLK